MVKYEYNQNGGGAVMEEAGSFVIKRVARQLGLPPGQVNMDTEVPDPFQLSKDAIRFLGRPIVILEAEGPMTVRMATAKLGG